MDKLARHLKDSGKTQSQFADEIGVSQAQVSRLIAEKVQPSPELARKIEQHTGGAVRYFDWELYAPFRPPQGGSEAA